MFGALGRVAGYLRAASVCSNEYEPGDAPSNQLSVSEIYVLHLCGQMLGCGIKQTNHSRYSAPPALELGKE